jgi:hypothetical protein
MFQNFDLLYFFGPALLVASMVLLVLGIKRNKKGATELSKAIDHFKITSMVFGALIIVLWLSLPSTPSLKTFGYPEDVSEIKGDAYILSLFQEYNKAIVRTTEVLQWFLFIFVWWFLTSLFMVAKAFKPIREKLFAQQ